MFPICTNSASTPRSPSTVKSRRHIPRVLLLSIGMLAPGAIHRYRPNARRPWPHCAQRTNQARKRQASCGVGSRFAAAMRSSAA